MVYSKYVQYIYNLISRLDAFLNFFDTQLKQKKKIKTKSW